MTASSVKRRDESGGLEIATEEISSKHFQKIILFDSAGNEITLTGAGAGAATAARQDTGNTSLANIDADTTTLIGHVDGIEGALTTLNAKDFATQTTLAAVLTELGQKTEPADTQLVSAASLPLPTGAATSANQTTIIGHVDGIETALTTLNAKDFATQATLAALLTELQLKADLTETQPVSAASLPLPTGAATLAEQQTQTASLSVLDDWDESDRSKVNIIVGQAGVTAGAGAVAANTPRVTHASDDPAVTALQIIDNIVSGSGANISQINGVTPLMGSGATGTGSPRVTAATDSPEVTSLGIIDDWDETDRAKVNIIVGQAGITAGAGAVAANTPRVTHASDDPAVTHLATIAGDTTDIEAAVEIMDDWDESDRCKVNPIVGQAGVQGGSGASTALTQRVAVATDANVVSTKTPLTYSAPSAVSVGTSSGVVLASNANRKGLIMCNTSSAFISFHMANGTAVLYSGITLPPYGIFQMDEFTFTTAAINGIASVASSNLSINEIT